MITAYSGYNRLLHAWIYSDETFTGHTPGNRMFAEGNDLYSYRYGAMIAKKLPNQTILVDTRSFSVTTSKQQTLLRRAIPSNWNIIYVEDPSSKPSSLIIRSIGKIKDYLDKIPKAHSRKLEHLQSAICERINILKLVTMYPEQCTLADYQFLTSDFNPETYIPNYAEWQTKENGKAHKRILKQQKEDEVRALKGEEQLALWLNFEANSCYSYTGLTRLRYNEKTQEIQTTQGITIHKDKVKELYELLKKGKDVIGLKIDNTYTVISLKDNVLCIGCHKLSLLPLLAFGSRVFKNENIHRPVQSSTQS